MRLIVVFTPEETLLSSNQRDVMVLDSGSEFFKYFRAPGAGGAAPAPAKK